MGSKIFVCRLCIGSGETAWDEFTHRPSSFLEKIAEMGSRGTYLIGCQLTETF